MEKIVASIRKQAGNTNSRMILILVGLSLVGFGAYAGLNQRNNAPSFQETAQPEVTAAPPEEASPKAESPHTVIYGFWAGNNSLIKAYNLETKASSVLAELPQNIKRITVKAPNTLYFINGTNNLDHGKAIIKSTFGGGEQTLVTADTGFGIDDYYISPDGNYLTTWEVQLKAGEQILYGGKSRVYSININNPTVKNLLYDEIADKPIHYPRGITNEGTVITDMFLPNSGPGWGYGMSVSNVSGSQKQDLPAMVNGTYGRQPRISHDGSMLSLSGYDGSKGSGTEQLEGVRKAIILPNTIELVDAKTLQRKKLENVSNRYLYDDTRFDKDGKHLLISQIKYINEEYKPHVLVYDLEKNTAIQVPNSMDKRGFEVLSDTQIFVSTPNVTGQTLGNLGETYQFLNSDFGIINPKDGKSVVLPISDSNMQFIGLFPNSELTLSSASSAEANRDALQLYSFTLKTDLLPNRINLQAKSRSNTSRVTNPNTLGIKTATQGNKLLAQTRPVVTIAPIIPEGFEPEPGQELPENFVRPDEIIQEPGNGNQAPDEQGVVPDQEAPVNGEAPEGEAPIDGEAPNGGVAPNGGELEIPGGGEIPDDMDGLLELLQQLLGILEEQAQN